MHLADAFIQSDLQCIQAIHCFYQYVCSPGNRTHKPFATNALPLSLSDSIDTVVQYGSLANIS